MWLDPWSPWAIAASFLYWDTWADKKAPSPPPTFAPPPLPLPSVRAAAIIAIRKRARDGRLSRGTILCPTPTTIARANEETAENAEGTVIHPTAGSSSRKQARDGR